MTVTGDADAADEFAGFVKRDASRNASQPACDRRGNRAAVDAVGEGGIVSGWIFEAIYVRERKVGKIDADERAGAAVFHARWKILLDDKTGRPRGESVLIAAQENGGAGARYGVRHQIGQSGRYARGAADAPDAKHVTFAVGHRDDAVWRDGLRAAGGLRDDLLNVCERQLCARRGDSKGGKQHAKQRTFHALNCNDRADFGKPN